ncbi:hypothetical protein ACQ5ES_09320 [Pseudidiomarina sp. E22-M8]|uniref:hypothetical protein n=1 Tax=Pseudidiomarina sp. E22-M8 TaxID=3424768 RepID=UPI00403CC55D
MRVIGRLLLLFTLLTVLIVIGYAVSNLTTFAVRDVQPWEERYARSIVYILRPGETLNFDVPNEATQVRILHTPVGVPAADEEAELRFQARPDTELNQTYTVTMHGDDEPIGANELPPRFFDSPQDDRAGLTQLHVVSFTDRQQLTEFALTLTAASRPLAIRVAVLERYDEKSVTRTWQRLNDEQRAAYFEDHIYPVELIPERERTAALMQRWQPIGPSSASNGDIISRTLFVNENVEIYSEEPGVVDELAVIGPQRWLTIDTRIQRTISEFSCASLTPVEAVNLQLSRVSQNEALVVTPLQLDSATERLAMPAEPNLYRFAADQRCELSFFDARGDVVVPEYHYLRSAVVRENNVLTFALVSESKQLQPLRLDARWLTRDATNLANDAGLQWTVVNEAGEQLLSGQLRPEFGVNPYQVAVDSSLAAKVHHKSSQYIVAPATAAALKVRLMTSEPADAADVLVNVYTRPADMPYRVDPSDENEPDQQQIPKWFLTRPLSTSEATVPVTRLLSWQVPLAEVATLDDGLEGEHWYSLSNLEDAPYFELFMAADKSELRTDVTERPANLLYYPINTVDADYTLTAPDHAQEVRPQLVYQKANAAPLAIEIAIDGKLLQRDWLNAQTGKLFLPALPQGNYQLSISPPDSVRWFSNYQSMSGQHPFRVRNAYKLKNQLSFELQKRTAEEWVTFNYFPAIAEPHQVTLTLVKEEQVGVFTDYTVSTRMFPIDKATAAPQVLLLNQNQPALWQPTRLPFLLGRDLNDSSYRIIVSSSVPNSGYIQAGYLAEAPNYQVEIYTEDGNALF